MTVDHDTVIARVRMFLQGGMTYNDALRRAYSEQRPYPIPSVAAIQRGEGRVS